MSRRAWREAEDLAKAGRWEAAGEAWRALAERAVRVQDRRAAREAAARAADAFRRDHRPAAAARMLRVAMEQGESAVMDQVQLAAVLVDAGQVDAAHDIAERALASATDPPAVTVALDTLVGLCLARGEVDAAREHLARVVELGLPGGVLASRFRGAQIDRLDGLGARAEAAWTALIEALAPMPQAVGPEGAAWAELGELDVLRAAWADDPEPTLRRAVERFERAGACWARAGRRAGVFRAEAWGARARSLLGEEVVAPAVDRAIGFAAERGMPMLEADLRACRAVFRRDADELLHVIDRLPEAPLARGRARVLRAELGGGADLDAAIEELRPDGPWTGRALAVLARERGDAALAEQAKERGSAL